MTDEELNGRFDQLHGSMRDMQTEILRSLERFDQLHEAMRDMQTEILRGLERFARGNFARMHRLEVSDNDLNERMNPAWPASGRP